MPAALRADAPEFRPLWTDVGLLLESARAGRLLPGARVRRAAWWEGGGHLSVRLKSPLRGNRRLSLLLADPGWRGASSPRCQSVMLLDGEGRLLDAVWSGKTGPGVYERFAFDADADPRILVVGHGAAGAAIAGVFLDELQEKYNLDGISLFNIAKRNEDPSLNCDNSYYGSPYCKDQSEMLEACRRISAYDCSFLREFQTAMGCLKPWEERISASVLHLAPKFLPTESAKSLVAGRLHPVWNYLLLARVSELLEGMTSEERAEAMKQFGAFEYPPSLLPLQAVREAVFLDAGN